MRKPRCCAWRRQVPGCLCATRTGRVRGLDAETHCALFPQAFGENIAILAGDALLALAFEYVAHETKGVSPDRVLQAVTVVRRGLHMSVLTNAVFITSTL